MLKHVKNIYMSGHISTQNQKKEKEKLCFCSFLILTTYNATKMILINVMQIINK